MDAIQRLIDIAKGEVGYLEKASNAYLYDKTKNAGSKNFTKYAKELADIGYFNGDKNGFQWCTTFVHWCFVKAFGEDNAYKLTCCWKGSSAAGCVYAVDYYKAKGQYHKNNPKVGDQIFFEYDGEPGHTGIVVAVDADRVYTIEGNTSVMSDVDVVPNGGGVWGKSYPLKFYRIHGYGRPDYSILDGYEPKETKPIEQTDREETVTVETRLIVKGMTGHDVEAMQILLDFRGYSCGTCGADGDYGNDTETALKTFQKENNLESDGECGKLTWGKLING